MKKMRLYFLTLVALVVCQSSFSMEETPEALQKKFGTNWQIIIQQEGGVNSSAATRQQDEGFSDKILMTPSPLILSQKFSDKKKSLIVNQIKNLLDIRQVKIDNLLNKVNTKYAEGLARPGNIVSMEYCVEMVYKSGGFNINTKAEDETLKALNMPRWVFDSFCNRVLLLSIDNIGQHRNLVVGIKEGAKILYEMWFVDN